MSFTINIYYTGENGSAKKFAEEMVEKGVVERVRAEKGNQKYEYFFPMDDPETVLLIDRWENQEALDAHHKSPMMKEIADLRDKYHLHMRVEQFVERKIWRANSNWVSSSICKNSLNLCLFFPIQILFWEVSYLKRPTE